MKKRINSKKKGTAYELAIIKELKVLLKTDNIHSTRSMNRILDSQKVDVCGDVPFNAQIKATESIPSVHKIFKEINRDLPPIIFWKKNNKPQLVIMEKDLFYKLLQNQK